MFAASGCSDRSETKMPTYRKNPNPSDVFELTIIIVDAPGSFKAISGNMQYDIANMDCLPPADPFSGVQTTPISTFLPISLEAINEFTYRGRVALDGLVDADYFGHGVCRFEAIGPAIKLKATGADGETRFVVNMDANAMSSAANKTSYFWQGNYPKVAKVRNYPDYGAHSPGMFAERLQDELFTITITTARTAQP